MKEEKKTLFIPPLEAYILHVKEQENILVLMMILLVHYAYVGMRNRFDLHFVFLEEKEEILIRWLNRSEPYAVLKFTVVLK